MRIKCAIRVRTHDFTLIIDAPAGLAVALTAGDGMGAEEAGIAGELEGIDIAVSLLYKAAAHTGGVQEGSDNRAAMIDVLDKRVGCGGEIDFVYGALLIP